MAVLYLVSEDSALTSCLAVADFADAILLIEDGVYAATRPVEWTGPLFALNADVLARGLSGRLADPVRTVTDAEFVELVVAHQPIVTWRAS